MLDEISKIKIGIVNTGACNIKSITFAMKRFSKNIEIIEKKQSIIGFDVLVVPGIGNFGQVMKNLARLDIIENIKEYIDQKKYALFICVGLQILFEKSDEDVSSRGLCIFKGKVKKFPKLHNGNDLKIPAIGWNKIFYKNENKLNNFEDLIDNNFYFTHSYYVEPEDKNIIHSEVDYGGFRYCSSVRFKNLLATQFHPEKSGITGLNLLRNFLIDSLNYEKNH